MHQFGPAGNLPSARGWLAVTLAGVVAIAIGVLVPAVSYLTFLVLILAAVLAAGTLAVQVRYSVLGIAVLVVSAVVLPIELRTPPPGGRAPNVAPILAAYVVGAWLVGLALTRRTLALREPVVRALLVFLAIAGLAFLVGQLPYYHVPGASIRAQVGGLGLFLLSGGLFLVVGHRVDHPRSLRRIVWLFLLAGGLVCVIQAIPPLDARLARVIGSETIGSAFWTWLVAMSVSQAVWNRTLSPAIRVVLLALAALALFRGLGLAFSWVSGWLPPLVAVAAIGLLRFPRSTVGVGLLSIGPLAVVGRMAFDALMTGEGYSYRTRIEAWTVIWDVVKANPWLGLGPANYYRYTAQFPIDGWYVNFSTHNNYLDLVAQIGIIGFLAFCWFVYHVGRLAFRLRGRVAQGFEKAYVSGCIAGLAGVLVSGMLADWIIPFAYNVGMAGFRSSLLTWVFLGGLLALQRMTIGGEARAAAR